MAETSKAQSDQLDDVKRWTAKRKSAVVLDLIKGKTTATDVARKHDLTVGEVEGWVERFLAGGEEQLRANPRDQEAQWDAERKQLHAKIGELALQIDVQKKANRIAEKAYQDGLS